MNEQKKVVIISRSSLQTERFMKHVRDHQAKNELNYDVELALYPKHMALILSYKPDFVLLSTEVIAWKPEIEKELNALGIPNALVSSSLTYL